MFKHTESIRRVGDVSLVAGDSYHNVTVEVTTTGGVTKVLTFSESEASSLAASIADALSERPKGTRPDTFRASIRAGKPA